MFGDKVFDQVGYPTPETTPNTATCLTLQIPANSAWWAIYVGLLLSLTEPEAWQQLEGGMSREDAAAQAEIIFADALAVAETNQCESVIDTPYWDTAADVVLQEPVYDQPWYGFLLTESTWQEQIEDWVLAGLVAYAAGLGAAIKFLTIAPRFRLAFRTHDLGAIVRVFIDAAQVAELDTYSAVPGVAYLDIFADKVTPDAENWTLWVEQASSSQLQVIRKRLDPAEVYPLDQRYNPDTDTTQREIGGVWVDDDTLDARSAPGLLVPPLTGADIACRAATNLTAYVHNFLDEVIGTLAAGLDALALATLLLPLLIELGPFAILIDLVIAAMETLLSLGLDVINLAMTNAVYASLLCDIDCLSGSDGQISSAEKDAILAAIAADYGSTSVVYLVLLAIFDLMGPVGMSNAAVLTDGGAADCSDCTCAWSYKWTFTASDGDWYGDSVNVNYSPYWGTWVSGQGWTAVYNGHSNGCGTEHDVCIRTPSFDIPAGSQLTGLHFASRGYNCGHSEFWCGTSRSEGLTAGRLKWYNSGTVLDAVEYSATGAPIESESGVYLNMAFEWTTDQWIYWAIVDGIGDKPAFTGGEWL